MNKSKVICTNGYFYQYDKKQMTFAQPYPPLGTLYAAAVLEESNYDVSFHDNNLVNHHKEIYKLIDHTDAAYLLIYDDGFNYLTKMCLTNMREACFDILAYAKAKGMQTMICSSDSTDHFMEYHEKGADFVLHGEGELSLEELMRTLKSNGNLTQVKGISYYQNNQLSKNPKRAIKKELDELPFPAWHLINLDKYKAVWKTKHNYYAINIATTRGCPYKCNWCAKPIYGNRYNTRSPKKVIEEISRLIEKFDVNYFWMCDDIFGLKPGWVQEFNRLKKEQNLNFKYKIQSRVDLMLKENNLDALAESGADIIWVGAESGSQKILDAMDKGTKVEQIYEATKLLKERDVKVAFFLQFGYLGESWTDIKKTLKMVLDLMPHEIGISVSYPLPGTKFHEMVKSELIQKANWTDSDDLDLMFENTYPPIFYKTLHRYIHNRYSIKKGWLSFQALISLKKGSIYSKMRDIAKSIYHLPFGLYNAFLLSQYKSSK